jgi:acyl-CoA synthetase (AMP-forming)/AMP-acid ligase II
MSLEIRAPDRRTLRCGERGEIWVRSPTLMSGYWNAPASTPEAIIDGWYATGDGGYLDAEGFLYLTDRIKDMIISGAENVYPAEVEEALRRHPAVLDAAVVGQPDERWGERVVGFAQLRPGAEVKADAVLAFVRTLIAGYKCPKVLHFVAELPRTASGKVQRGKLREAARPP